jgi:hypothetical protein
MGSVFTVYLPRAGDVPDEALDTRTCGPRGHAQYVTVVDDEQVSWEPTMNAKGVAHPGDAAPRE